MTSDYWEPNNQVFVHFGMRYGVLPETCRTVCIGSVEDLTRTVEEPPPVRVVTVHKIQTVEEVKRPRGRPPVVLKEQQLSFLTADLSIREKAKRLGVSTTKAFQLVKAGVNR